MYAKVKNSQLIKFPYGFFDLVEENPSFAGSSVDLFTAFETTAEWQEGARIEQVTFQNPGVVDNRKYTTSHAEQPELVEGAWVRKCILTEKTTEEVAKDNLDQSQLMRAWRDQVLLNTSDRINPMRWEEMTDEQKQAHRTYRQALLDLPQQAGFPWEVIWPVAP